MFKPRPLLFAVFCSAFALVAQAVPDAGGQISSAPAPDISGDAAMKARLNYNIGFEKYEKAQKLEVSAGGLSGARAKEAQQQVQRGFTEAREHFRTVVATDPNLKEAWNLIGYTSRRLGEYEESLSAYDAALKLSPDYPEAIEYRAELFLLTGRLDDVKSAHAQLAKSSPSYAAVLLESARSWVQAQQKKLTVVSAADRDAFAAWVQAQPKS
jgi:tetratricopeptide (TPR) repeat protein